MQHVQWWDSRCTIMLLLFTATNFLVSPFILLCSKGGLQGFLLRVAEYRVIKRAIVARVLFAAVGCFRD